MRKSLCRGALRALPLLVLAVFMSVQAQAVPLTAVSSSKCNTQSLGIGVF